LGVEQAEGKVFESGDGERRKAFIGPGDVEEPRVKKSKLATDEHG
jgi:hypothetical protein